MSDIEIKYNNKRVPMAGTGPTPFLSLNNEVVNYGNRWGVANRITLNGQITGVDYNALYHAQTGLVDILYFVFNLSNVCILDCISLSS